MRKIKKLSILFGYNFFVVVSKILLVSFFIISSIQAAENSSKLKKSFNKIIEENDTTITVGDLDTIGFKGNKSVDSIIIETLDPFADAKKNSKFEAFTYGILDKVHITTRDRVIKRNLIFAEEDSISQNTLIESERILRSKKYLSDASIKMEEDSLGNSIARIKTSDKWTLSVPAGISNSSGENDEWSFLIGLRENNFLGLGQNLGFYYNHTPERNIYLAEYATGFFFFPHVSFNLSGGVASDGYFTSYKIQKPFLSRSRNEWAYTAEGDFRKEDYNIYYSHEDLSHTIDVATDLANQLNLDNLVLVKDTNTNLLWRYKGVRKDTLSFRISRSLGSSEVKHYFRLGYDYSRILHPLDTNSLELSSSGAYRLNEKYVYPIYKNSDNRIYSADTSVFQGFPERNDSRISIGYTFDWSQYLRLKNYHRIKWTEDITLGFQLFNLVSRNFKSLGADSDNWKFYHKLRYVVAPTRNNIFTLIASTNFYADGDSISDMYSQAYGEYIFKAHVKHSSVFKARVDGYYNAPVYKRLYLGGGVGMLGLPLNYLSGQNRTLFEFEQRWYPDIEFGTLIPVMALFLNAGNVYQDFDDFDPNDFYYTVGFSLNLGLSKSVDGIINKASLSWPLNGPLENGIKGIRYALITVFSL